MTTLTKDVTTSPPRYHGQPMSADEFAALPDDGYQYEYVEGVATMMSPAGGLHGDIASRLTYLLGAYLYPHEIGRLFDSSTGFRLPNGDVRVPDIVVILQGRLPREGSPVGFIEIAPGLAVEVISPMSATKTFSRSWPNTWAGACERSGSSNRPPAASPFVTVHTPLKE